MGSAFWFNCILHQGTVRWLFPFSAVVYIVYSWPYYCIIIATCILKTRLLGLLYLSSGIETDFQFVTLFQIRQHALDGKLRFCKFRSVCWKVCGMSLSCYSMSSAGSIYIIMYISLSLDQRFTTFCMMEVSPGVVNISVCTGSK